MGRRADRVPAAPGVGRRLRDPHRPGQPRRRADLLVLTEQLLWYVAYGSNLHAARLDRYLRGGRPSGGLRTYPGCRDCRPPRRTAPGLIPGGVYFAGESRAWTGGMAFYDPELPGRAAVRGYLVTVEQFADVAAQEMYRPPGTDLDLIRVAAETGRATLGPGRYETLLRVGTRDGLPMLTFTAPHRASEVDWTSPAPVYLGMLARGLREAHGWDVAAITGYLAARPGVRGNWPRSLVRRLAGEAVAGRDAAEATGTGSRWPPPSAP
ncbi:histone deacetylase [Micromonospora chersina]|uniref:histone deacetylase n=1 Tax=Micromonospora chersina TaxID=47854 RepID=UPI003684C448